MLMAALSFGLVLQLGTKWSSPRSLIYDEKGSYPATEQGLAVLVTRPSNESRWQGPYLAKMPPSDPWGRPYVYKYPGERAEFDLLSFGKDGQPGGEGEAADIKNW